MKWVGMGDVDFDPTIDDNLPLILRIQPVDYDSSLITISSNYPERVSLVKDIEYVEDDYLVIEYIPEFLDYHIVDYNLTVTATCFETTDSITIEVKYSAPYSMSWNQAMIQASASEVVENELTIVPADSNLSNLTVTGSDNGSLVTITQDSENRKKFTFTISDTVTEATVVTITAGGLRNSHGEQITTTFKIAIFGG